MGLRILRNSDTTSSVKPGSNDATIRATTCATAITQAMTINASNICLPSIVVFRLDRWLTNYNNLLKATWSSRFLFNALTSRLF
jgi:hypothetical protein